MPYEKLASAENILKGNLASAWNILEGTSGDYTDLGIARRFGGAAAAYSLRDIGAMNGRVVRVRRSSDNQEEDFSANQVAIGLLETFVGSGNDGFVTKWYDQSGNNRPLIQATTSEQPSIVENGVFLDGVKADVATSNSTMKNLQVSTDGTTPNFGTDDWANGGTKLGLIYVGKITDSFANNKNCVFWGGGRGVSGYQSGGVSLQILKQGTDNWKLVNERNGLTPDLTAQSALLDTNDDVICYGTADNRDFTLKVNNVSSSGTEVADLDTREDAAISLFGAYSNSSTSNYHQRSTAGVCKECYLFSGDNIAEIDTIATEINKHYNIYS